MDNIILQAIVILKQEKKYLEEFNIKLMDESLNDVERSKTLAYRECCKVSIKRIEQLICRFDSGISV